MSATVVQFPAGDKSPEPEPAKVRLNLGCNQNALPGYVNVDIENYAGVDVVADLERRWPWEDDSVDEIFTADLPEHLRGWYESPDPTSIAAARKVLSKTYTELTEVEVLREAIDMILDAIDHPKRTYGVIHFMNEAWRVLKPGGMLRARIPTTDSKAWAQDPTHVSFWNENTLLYFTHDNYRAIYPKQIKAKFEPLEVKTLMPNHYGEAWVICVLRKAPL